MTDTFPPDRPFAYRPNTTDEGMIWQIFHNKDYDLSRLRRGNELLAYWRAHSAVGKRPLIVDAGANIGAASVYFSREFPNAEIVAIEPDPENFKVLSINAADRSITCINAAVTARPGLMRIVDPGEGSCGFRTIPAGDDAWDAATAESVQITRIFDTQPPGVYPFIVKIDIEGAEGELFSGNIEWLARTPLVIIELHDWLIPKQRTSRSFLQAVASLDRDFVYIGENVFSIDNRL